jgi:hypothetical protein
MALYVAATGDDGGERRDGVLTGVGNFGGGDRGVGGVSLDTECDLARRGGIASSVGLGSATRYENEVERCLDG